MIRKSLEEKWGIFVLGQMQGCGREAFCTHHVFLEGGELSLDLPRTVDIDLAKIYLPISLITTPSHCNFGSSYTAPYALCMHFLVIIGRRPSDLEGGRRVTERGVPAFCETVEVISSMACVRILGQRSRAV